MNFFKKYLRKTDKPFNNKGYKKIDIDNLINSDNLNDSIIELDDYICALCEYGERIDLLNESQKVFYYNQNLEREVNNGGFNQFYLNSSGDFAHETVDSLQAIGAKITSDVIKHANDQFPKGKVPKNRELRQDILEQIEGAADEVWEELEQEFFKYNDDLNSLNMEFIKNNRSQFEEKDAK